MLRGFCQCRSCSNILPLFNVMTIFHCSMALTLSNV
uniref:Uncharacterized protein n=1 Tax=Rhizophora mucronata TaxID=61149 RepID=A0A2P2NMP0_RHIMU